MNSKNFVNFHVLISHSPSCLNRDDANMQKTAIFGGVTRVRISSQSMKYWMRKSDYYNQRFSKSMRTRFLIDEAVNCLIRDNPESSEATEASGLIIAALLEGKTKPEDIKKYKRNEKSGKIQHQVLPFSTSEIEGLNALIKEISSKPENQQIDFAKSRFKELEEKTKKFIDIDVALSGRMATSDLAYGTDGALAVAHPITTHAVEPQDVDWFSAVDDLQDQGSGHLDTQQFSAGVFYRYASLNLKQLQVNLGLIENMKTAETPESRSRALEIAKHLFHMLATVVPSAMQGRHAAFNPADFAIVSFSDQPISLANAFEAPIQRGHNGGYLGRSMVELAEYWRRLNSAYGLNESAAAFRFGIEPWQAETKKKWPDNLPAFEALAELETWIAKDGTKTESGHA